MTEAIGELPIKAPLLRGHAVIVPLGALMISSAGLQLEEEISFLSIALGFPPRLMNRPVKLALVKHRQLVVMENEACALCVGARLRLTDR